MKQYMKRVVLVLTMVACLFSLSACSAGKAAEESTLDPQVATYITQSSESLMQSIAALTADEAEQTESSLLEQDQAGLASGVTSWMSVMKDTGAFVSVISSETQMTEDKAYECTVMAQFENRPVEFKAFFTLDKQTQQLMPTSIAFSPEYSTGEKMSKAGMNTLMGMGTVFCVLIFISLLISCFTFINAFEQKMKNKNAAPAAPVAAPAPVAAQEEELVDDLELVAVITAAIAAATNSSTDGLVVRSIKRASGATWKRA